MTTNNNPDSIEAKLEQLKSGSVWVTKDGEQFSIVLGVSNADVSENGLASNPAQVIFCRESAASMRTMNPEKFVKNRNLFADVSQVSFVPEIVDQLRGYVKQFFDNGMNESLLVDDEPEEVLEEAPVEPIGQLVDSSAGIMQAALDSLPVEGEEEVAAPVEEPAPVVGGVGIDHTYHKLVVTESIMNPDANGSSKRVVFEGMLYNFSTASKPNGATIHSIEWLAGSYEKARADYAAMFPEGNHLNVEIHAMRNGEVVEEMSIDYQSVSPVSYAVYRGSSLGSILLTSFSEWGVKHEDGKVVIGAEASTEPTKVSLTLA